MPMSVSIVSRLACLLLALLPSGTLCFRAQVPAPRARRAAAPLHAGRVEIEYCTGCKWMIRGSWVAQELLQTFENTLESVSLVPSQTSGTFEVRVDGEVVHSRSRDGGFPEAKELKRKIRDIIAPGAGLGHIDGHAAADSSDAAPQSAKPAAAGDRRIIATDKAPAAVGPYSQAVSAGDFLFVSGQVGLVPETGKLAAGGVEEEARQALENLKAVCEAAGLTMGSVVKTTVLLADIDDYKVVNEIYASYFTDSKPARAAFQAGALPIGARVEIEAIATRRG